MMGIYQMGYNAQNKAIIEPGRVHYSLKAHNIFILMFLTVRIL